MANGLNGVTNAGNQYLMYNMLANGGQFGWGGV
jgi:hypothetical protein